VVQVKGEGIIPIPQLCLLLLTYDWKLNSGQICLNYLFILGHQTAACQQQRNACHNRYP
jgi:hypothetical protein